MTSDDKVTYFATTDSRNKRVKFGIKAEDRTRHVYVIGKTGMGKSTLLENMAVQDIQSGEGLAFIDPHGKTAELLLNYIPENRIKDVVYFAPFDIEYPMSFNVMEDVGYDKRHLVVSGLMSTFKKIWVDAWSARMEYILSNTLLALLEYPDATLLGVNKMLSDKIYRKKVVDNITDPAVKSFWVDEFAKYTEKFAAEATPAIQNKIGQFTNNPLIRNIIGQPKSSFDIRKMMDERKILIINLSKGRVGESNANLLGSMLITKIYLGAMSRADVSEKAMKSLPNFYLYVDEFQSFANESFADILSEARKYKLNLTIAHQYVEQMSEEVRAAVFGNVGTMIVFRVGSIDAEAFEKEFAPKFTAEDIVNLGKYQIYLRLMIDGMGSQPFSATNLPPIALPPVSFKTQVIDSSRATYGHPRAQVEEYIKTQALGPSIEEKKERPAGQYDQRQDSRPDTRRDDRPNYSAAPRSESPRPQSYDRREEASPRQENREPQRSEQRFDSRSEPRRDAYSSERREYAPRDRQPAPASMPAPVPHRDERRIEKPAPPADSGDGFLGFDALKSYAAGARPLNENRAPRDSRPPEKKGVTPESRNDLKQALAALIKPEAKSGHTAEVAQPKKIEATHGQHMQKEVSSAPKVAATSEPRPSLDRETREPVRARSDEPKQAQKMEVNEVPEDVLKKLLEI